MNTQAKKISMNFSEETINEIRELAERYNVTMTEATRRAVAVMKFVDDRKRAGADFLIRDPESKEIERLIIT